MLVPIIEESGEVIRRETLDHFLLAKAHHDVGIFVPGLANLDVAILLLDLQLVLIHRVKGRDEARFYSLTNLLASFSCSGCLHHLLCRVKC